MKLILSLILIFTLWISPTFKHDTVTPVVAASSNTVSYIEWTPSNSGYWTQYTSYSVYNDFEWSVVRSKYPDDYGQYYYYVWFYSQSYFWDGYNAKYTSTNIKNIKIYANDVLTTWNTTDLGCTFNGEYNAANLNFKIASANPKFEITWGHMSAK